jgi:hypothetical protein
MDVLEPCLRRQVPVSPRLEATNLSGFKPPFSVIDKTYQTHKNN